eukprot:scaffold704_cov347-Prasinococcus_capsulatus_cf.AAC.45
MTFRSLRHPVTHLINTACRTRSMERNRAAQGLELFAHARPGHCAPAYITCTCMWKLLGTRSDPLAVRCGITTR